jgi:colanic acid/amylovoran biosynthesis glycosyltransferase
MKTIAHCVSPYLHVSEQWLHSQIARLRRYRPVVLTQETQNLEGFPVATLYAASSYPAVQKGVNRLVRKLTGKYPFYGGILKRERADLIHAHFGYQGHFCRRAQKVTGLPMLISFYGEDGTKYLRYPRWLRRYRQLFEAGDAFLVEGNAMRQRLVEIGCPPEKLRLHHLGVDVERIAFQPRQPADKVRFLICAGFKEKKGIPYALLALSRVLEKRPFPCEVVLIGDGPERGLVLEGIERSGLQEQVKLRGLQPYSQVMEEMQHCHILLQTSITAANGDGEGGAPVILLDAQASGMPVVASYHADIPEYVLDGQSGLLAPERDVEALAECIRTLVENPQRWATMGQAGRRHVEQNYNVAVQCAGLETIYDEFTK